MIEVGLALAGAALLFYYSPSQRRKRARRRPFPPEWEGYLQSNLKLYGHLPPPLRNELKGHIQIFLEEKNFEGCGGLVITDEIRVTVAGLACLLLLNRRTRHYPGLGAILIYPAGYFTEDGSRLGESWDNGTVVLSWCDVKRSAHDLRDGHNLVLHEFAHQLDQEDGSSDGIPIMEQKSSYTAWAAVLNEEYRRLVELTEKRKKDVLDDYGATNPAEFFAVATETFFEKPVQLQRKHPELYDQLKSFYHLDPVSWKR